MKHQDPADGLPRPDSVAAPAHLAPATAPARPIPAPAHLVPATALTHPIPAAAHLAPATALDRSVPATAPDRSAPAHLIPATAPDRSVPADVPDPAGVADVRERLDSVAAPGQPVAAAALAGGRDSGEGRPPLAVAVHWADTYVDSPVDRLLSAF